MNKFCSIFLVLCFAIFACNCISYDEYVLQREILINAELKSSFDSDIVLDAREKIVDSLLAKLRSSEIDSFGYMTENFYHNKAAIEASPLFAFLRSMPKGGLLHVHYDSMADYDKILVKFASYLPECYIWRGSDQPNGGGPQNGALNAFPLGQPSDPNWVNVNVERAKCGNSEMYDRKLLATMTLSEIDDQGNSTDAWNTFNRIFGVVGGGILSYEPVWDAWFSNAFESLVKDGVQYVEIRAGPMNITDRNGVVHDTDYTYQKWQKIIEQTKKNTPWFQGARLIVTDWRGSDQSLAYSDMLEALRAKILFPDLVVGFDMVGQEDAGHTTFYFAQQLLSIQDEARRSGVDFPFFFHDGESDKISNENLYDAILLGTKRIGHAIQLINHPLLIQMVQERDICIELCPVSNLVLRFVSNLQLHPGTGFARLGLPITLNTDDPAIFDVHSMAHDLYQVVIGWDFDLSALKKLSLNAISCSRMTNEEKVRANAVFDDRWQAWIDVVAKEYVQFKI